MRCVRSIVVSRSGHRSSRTPGDRRTDHRRRARRSAIYRHVTRSAGPDRVSLVTDAMAATGMADGSSPRAIGGGRRRRVARVSGTGHPSQAAPRPWIGCSDSPHARRLPGDEALLLAVRQASLNPARAWVCVRGPRPRGDRRLGVLNADLAVTGCVAPRSWVVEPSQPPPSDRHAIASSRWCRHSAVRIRMLGSTKTSIPESAGCGPGLWSAARRLDRAGWTEVGSFRRPHGPGATPPVTARSAFSPPRRRSPLGRGPRTADPTPARGIGTPPDARPRSGLVAGSSRA